MKYSGYLDFRDWTPGGQKTRTIYVYSAKRGDIIGYIKWYGAWRQYAFYPEPQTIWNKTCLEEIIEHINHLMEMRRKERAKK